MVKYTVKYHNPVSYIALFRQILDPSLMILLEFVISMIVSQKIVICNQILMSTGWSAKLRTD